MFACIKFHNGVINKAVYLNPSNQNIMLLSALLQAVDNFVSLSAKISSAIALDSGG